MRKYMAGLCILVCATGLLYGCGAKETARPQAVITFSTGLVLRAELYDDLSPNTVANFIALAESGYYNRTYVYAKRRGDAAYMGSVNSDGTGGPEYTIQGEFSKNGVQNNVPFDAGNLIMERTGGYDSESACFIISGSDRPELASAYAPLGHILKEDMNKLSSLFDFDTDSNGMATDPFTITGITVDRMGREFPTPVYKQNRH